MNLKYILNKQIGGNRVPIIENMSHQHILNLFKSNILKYKNSKTREFKPNSRQQYEYLLIKEDPDLYESIIISQNYTLPHLKSVIHIANQTQTTPIIDQDQVINPKLIYSYEEYNIKCVCIPILRLGGN